MVAFSLNSLILGSDVVRILASGSVLIGKSNKIFPLAYSSRSLATPRRNSATTRWKRELSQRSVTSTSLRSMSGSDSFKDNMKTADNADIMLDNTARPTRWSELRPPPSRQNPFPALTTTAHKGSHGRIAILGGSERYTGAPYYAATSALHCGVDLAFVFCAEEASVAIKCYSPELMVLPVYSFRELDQIRRLADDDDEEEGLAGRRRSLAVRNMVDSVVATFHQLHVLVIGPGLGRNDIVFQAVAQIIRKAKEHSLFLVLDADALFLLTLEPYVDLLTGYQNVVLTPNLMEWKRLTSAFLADRENKKHLCANEQKGKSDLMESYLRGNIVVQKGNTDIITHFHLRSSHNQLQQQPTEAPKSHDLKIDTMICQEEGGLKRSGGIGDVLSGAIGAFLAWDVILSKQQPSMQIEQREVSQQRLFATWAACCAVKQATRSAFLKKRRAMSAMDVLEELGQVIQKMEEKLDSGL